MVTFVGGSTAIEPQPQVEENKVESLEDKSIINSIKEDENIDNSPDINLGATNLEQQIEKNEEVLNNEIVENVKEPEIKIVDETKKEETQIEKQEEKPILKKAEEKLTEITKWDDDKPVKLGVFNFINKSERTIFLAFIIPPLVISLISMIHVVSFFELSNNYWLSWALAAAFEFASISALFALTALTRIKKNTIWILFFAIVTLQVIGNMYHSYIYMNPQDGNLLKMLSILGIESENLPWTLRILGFLQGGILPIVSLSFIKGLVEYLRVNRDDK